MNHLIETGCAFCAIAQGEADADVVYEVEHVVAFLDRKPLFPGHVLIIPRDHYPTLADLPDGRIGPIFTAAKLLARTVQRALKAQGTFVAINNVVSQSVPHLHVHVVPRNRGDGLRGFFWPRNAYDSDQHRREVAEQIRQTLNAPNAPLGERPT
ncbi:MAG: HIT family protein [Phycisphaeraceae bacterium]